MTGKYGVQLLSHYIIHYIHYYYFLKHFKDYTNFSVEYIVHGLWPQTIYYSLETAIIIKKNTEYISWSS